MGEKNNTRTYWKVFTNLGIMLFIILFCIFAVPRLIFYFMPFIVGWIISLIASPIVHFFEKSLKIKRKAGSAVTIIAVIALVILAAYFIGEWFVEQAVDFVQELPQMWEGAQQDFQEVGEKLAVAYQYLPANLQTSLNKILVNVEEYLGGAMGEMSTPAFEALGRFAQNLPGILIGIIMCLLSSYFFVADKEYMSALLTKVMPLALLERLDMVKRGLKRAVGGYFKAQLKIEIWMYLLLCLGFTILRIRYAFLIAIGVAFLDLLPFFGTGTVLLPWAVVKFLSGDYGTVVGLLVIWGVGQLARQLIQPKIVGDSMGLSPIPTLFLLYIGFRAAGVIGMIIAVPIGIIVLYMYEEGVFDTTINSLKVLYASINNFRHLKEEDMKPLEIYRQEEQRRISRNKKKAEKGTAEGEEK